MELYNDRSNREKIRKDFVELMKTPLIFAQIGREVLPRSARADHQLIRLRFSSDSHPGDFYTGVRNFRELLGPSWNARSFDLLNVMCALRAADRFFVSKGMYSARRRLPFAVGVTDVSHWRKLREPLAQAIKALSEDAMDFYPLQLPRKPKMSTPGEGDGFQSYFDKHAPDCVCLYSGGADSFAGAAFLLDQGRHPVLVSHSIGPVSGLQKRLFESLRDRFPQLHPNWLVQTRAFPKTTLIKRNAADHRPYWQNRDQLQRLRSMFFFSLAAIVANALNVDEIFMCENGLIGAAIVFSPRDDTPYTTRPAEPHYLRSVESFLQLALDRPSLRIRNPFQYMTKGEVLNHAAGLGFQQPLHHTVSCWRSGNRGVRNCGECVPCLFRQLAFSEAGLPDPPPAYAYRVPIPKKNWRKWRSKELERLEDIRDYCELALKQRIAGLMGNELAVVDAIDITRGSVRNKHITAAEQDKLDQLAPRKMANVILRFAQATLERLP